MLLEGSSLTLNEVQRSPHLILCGVPINLQHRMTGSSCLIVSQAPSTSNQKGKRLAVIYYGVLNV